MTCIQCFQKIAPSTLEKSCNGEHRQQGEGEEEWEFPRGAKGVQGLCLPLGSREPPSLTLHAHSPPQADLRLSPLWRLREPVFPVHLWMWREPAAKALEAKLCPQRWGPWRTVSTLLSCSWPVNEAKPQGLFFWCFSLHHSSFRSPVRG